MSAEWRKIPGGWEKVAPENEDILDRLERAWGVDEGWPLWRDYGPALLAVARAARNLTTLDAASLASSYAGSQTWPQWDELLAALDALGKEGR